MGLASFILSPYYDNLIFILLLVPFHSLLFLIGKGRCSGISKILWVGEHLCVDMILYSTDVQCRYGEPRYRSSLLTLGACARGMVVVLCHRCRKTLKVGLWCEAHVKFLWSHLLRVRPCPFWIIKAGTKSFLMKNKL